MNAIILSEGHFKKLENLILQIKIKLDAVVPTQKFIDNAEFLALLKVSKRTAQFWRDTGMIAYSQVGNKIYYQLNDVEAFLQARKIKSVNQFKSK